MPQQRRRLWLRGLLRLAGRHRGHGHSRGHPHPLHGHRWTESRHPWHHWHGRLSEWWHSRYTHRWPHASPHRRWPPERWHSHGRRLWGHALRRHALRWHALRRHALRRHTLRRHGHATGGGRLAGGAWLARGATSARGGGRRRLWGGWSGRDQGGWSLLCGPAIRRGARLRRRGRGLLLRRVSGSLDARALLEKDGIIGLGVGFVVVLGNEDIGTGSSDATEVARDIGLSLVNRVAISRL
mmetsp:Transcript_8776/g.13807  ORF Transcript_8776/g.13807 Transcript_8776/m.13807 type:complete len:240 (-) Transcript_8776:1342-2061(-)